MGESDAWAHLRPGGSQRRKIKLAGGSGRAGGNYGIARGSDEREECSERKAQQGAATNAHTICDYVPEFHGAAGREVLTGFEENSEDEHREAR